MENNIEIPLGVGAVIVNGDTGEVIETPITKEELAEMKKIADRLSS
jgi:hypothetical protein